MRPIAVRFSRNGFTSPLGKLTAWTPGRQRIEPEVADRFAARAAQAGKPAAEVVRDLIRVAALGPEQASRMYGEGVLKVVRLIAGMSDEPPE